MGQQRSEISIQSSLPSDIAFKIVSSLQVLDVCALGSCSRFWRELCSSDSIWEPLTRNRWPLAPFLQDASSSSSSSASVTEVSWRDIYIRMHRQMADRASSVIKLVEGCASGNSIEVGDYCKAIEDLSSKQFAFGDIQMFLFKPKLNVLLNLIGLHYCICCLQVPVEHMMDALLTCGISEKQLTVKWWKLGRWFYGFRMKDEIHSRLVSLADLLTQKGEEVLGVLRRGAIHEVFRVEISIPNTASTSWCCQSSQKLQ